METVSHSGVQTTLALGTQINTLNLRQEQAGSCTASGKTGLLGFLQADKVTAANCVASAVTSTQRDRAKGHTNWIGSVRPSLAIPFLPLWLQEAAAVSPLRSEEGPVSPAGRLP